MRITLIPIVLGASASSVLADGDCTLDPCPPGEFIEPESCGDDVNGGCASTPQVFWDPACGETWCGTAWADGGTRDTDWYIVEDFQGGPITATLVSEFPGVVFIVGGLEQCAPFVIAEGSSVDCRSTGAASAEIEPGLLGVVFVATASFEGFPCGTSNDYRVTIECCAPNPCVEDFDGDEQVGVTDLVLLLLAWETNDPKFDINGDGDVDVEDLVALILAWGPCATC
jgi:hypothetical protein